MKKTGAIEMSFGMMFSIFLIIMFIVVAIYAINYFLNLSRCSQINLFVNDLQKSVDDLWKGQKGQVVFSASLPGKIQKICFADMSQELTGDEEVIKDIRRDIETGANFYFYPAKNSCGDPHRTIKHINITGMGNPFCFDNKDKINIKLEKGFFDALVRIGK